MANAVWKAYDSAPNCAYVIGKDGEISEAQPWMDPTRLRLAVERAVTARWARPFCCNHAVESELLHRPPAAARQ